MFEHEVFGKIEVAQPLKHRHVEGFYEAVQDIFKEQHSPIYNDGKIVSIACEVGIISDKIDVPESDPAMIAWLALQVADYVKRAREIPEKN